MTDRDKMTVREALAILYLEVDVPIGVSISHDGGHRWPTFRFSEMAHPHDERICAQIAVALETLVRAVKDDDLITRDSLKDRLGQ